MSTLIVAAGGGGDAVAAIMLSRFIAPDQGLPYIATYAWERLRIDPQPGPRGADGFTGLGSIGDYAVEIVGSSETIPPGCSTLPRLRDSAECRLFLLDPTRGATGMRGQLQSLVSSLSITKLVVLDVGGDVLARGDEPELLSPMADALAVAAVLGMDVEVEVAVAGPGIDGELSESYTLASLQQLGGNKVATVEAKDADKVFALLDWHPSEATALLAASATGVVGRVEIRRFNKIVELTESSSSLWTVDPSKIVEQSLLVGALAKTNSLDDVEDAIRKVTVSELDYERTKAVRIDKLRLQELDSSEISNRVRAYSRDAKLRGVDYITGRRLAEAIEVPTFTIHELLATLGADPNDYLRGALLDVMQLAV